MKVVTSIKQAKEIAKTGEDCIAVFQTASEEQNPIIGGWVRTFAFYNYTSKNGKVGWKSFAKAYQIYV